MEEAPQRFAVWDGPASRLEDRQEAANMQGPFEVLDRLYKKALAGATLEEDAQEYVRHLRPAFPDADAGPGTAASEPAVTTPGVRGEAQPPPCPARPAPGVPAAPAPWRSSARDLALLRLTVTRVMASRALAADTGPRAREQYRGVLAVLLTSSDLDSRLIRTFQHSDKLLSHVTAKCLAWLLYFQLREQITLSNSWIAFCQKSLSEYSESDKVVYCLWTLTAVIKEIFKDTCSQKSDLLKRFLAPLDTALEAFYGSFFSPGAGHAASSLPGALELLELLVASRALRDLRLPCQRLVFLRPSWVLRAATRPGPAFAQAGLILFLKKCVLWRAGEDLCRGAGAAAPPALAAAPPDRHRDGDTAALAGAVLQAVDAGFLGTVSVRGKPSCFAGGEARPGGERPPGPDHVILRATSLLVIKSLEITIQKCASAKEMKVALQRYMSELLAFLQPHLRPSVPAHNPCEWLSRVFIEQDDDMLEAARASLGIYLKLTREQEAAENEAQGRDAWRRHTHEHGYNPHCIFLFLLRNVGFDSTVLLDFLISSETCFLEYFVRYLKLLPQDWAAFLTVCKHFDAADRAGSVNPCGRTSSSSSSLGHDTGAESRPPAACGRPGNTHAAQSLVDYDTSDDSEAESPDLCPANSKQTPVPREAAGRTRDTVETRRGKRERSSEPPPPGPVVPEETDPPRSAGCDHAACEVGTFDRTATCFQELRGAVSRLHRKNLFPYNPTALLRLLKQVEAVCNKRTSPF